MLCARNNRSKNCWKEYKGNLESKVFDHIQPCSFNVTYVSAWPCLLHLGCFDFK